MSNAGQAALSVIGATVGFFLGGPTGAVYGFQLGYLAGTALFPTQLPTLQGPRLGEGQQTVSLVGAPIPMIFGTQTVGGIIIWASPIREVATNQELGGKGAPEQSQTTYSYFRSFAILLCSREPDEGPIGGIRRIWANGKLILDRSTPPAFDPEDVIQEVLRQLTGREVVNSEWTSKMTVYLGSEDQMPDPVIESFEGVGNVPAMRGYAYVVFDDVELKPEDGNRIPASWKFEVYEEAVEDNVDLTVYNNEVLYPWNTSDLINPINPNNRHDFAFNSVHYDSLVEAQEGIKAALDRSYPYVTAYTVTPTQPIAIFGGETVSDHDRVSVQLRLNTYEPRTGYFQVGVGVSCSFVQTRDVGEILYSNLAAFGYAVVRITPPGTLAVEGWDHYVDCNSMDRKNAAAADDVTVTVTRLTSPPPNPCDAGTSLPGFGIYDGQLVPCGDWELDTSTTYKVLQKYVTGGAPALVLKYPLSPARPLGHPQYNDQAFWENEYAIAVARGDMPEGLTYGVDYPEVQSFGYKKSLDTSVITTQPVSIASIVRRICRRVGLEEIDVQDLEDITVIGYQISRPMLGRAAIDVRPSLGYFDVRDL